MAQSHISDRRLQRIYEGARCSAVERRFIIERLRISERVVKFLADEAEVIHSAEQFAMHLLQGEGLVGPGNRSPVQAQSGGTNLLESAKRLMASVRMSVNGLRV